MNDKKIVEEIPFGRPGITLVKRKGDNYWQMKNSDGDVWGKFYSGHEQKYPHILRCYQISGGKKPFHYDEGACCRYIDTNGYYSDYYYDNESGYYNYEDITWVQFSYYSWTMRRDCNGNHSIRVFERVEDRWGSDCFKGSEYHDYCFEKNGKIKFLYELKTIHTGDNGIQLLMEDRIAPINKEVKYNITMPSLLSCFKDTNGELSEPFYKAWGYNNGWARVQKYRLPEDIQYRDEKGNLSRLFAAGTDYINGYAVVLIEDKGDGYCRGPKKYCLRDIEGNLSTTWFKSEGEALQEIKLGNAKTYFEKRIYDTKVDEEKLKSYYYVSSKNKYGFRVVQKYIAGDYQFVDQNGNLSEPFYYINNYNYYVQKSWNSGQEVLDHKTGHLSQEVYHVRRGYGDDNCCVVQLKPNGPYHLMDTEGNISEGFCEIGCEENGFRAVQKSFFHPYQIIDKNWHLSQKKYPDKDSAQNDILNKNFKFEKEKVATINPRPKKKTEQNDAEAPNAETTLISSMIDNNSITSDVTDDVAITAPKTDLEKYLSNEISVYELDAEHFKG